jgi:hypothetical protein
MQNPTYIIQKNPTDGEVINKWNSIDEILEKNSNFKKYLIEKNLSGVIKMAYGFCWSYYTHLEEIWKPLYYFPDFDISNYGIVKNNKTQELVPTLVNDNGHPYVVIHTLHTKLISGIYYNALLYVLVADTFLENYNYYPYVGNDHAIVYYKDGNKSNVRSDNLTFDRPIHMVTKINKIDLQTGKVIETFPSLRQLFISVPGLNIQNVVNTCRGICNCSGGFGWQYVIE